MSNDGSILSNCWCEENKDAEIAEFGISIGVYPVEDVGMDSDGNSKPVIAETLADSRKFILLADLCSFLP